MLSGFKKFILRGNVIDMGVGVVIGASFNTIVSDLVKDIITPFIGVFGGKQAGLATSTLSFSVNGSQFMYGDFLDSLISFLIIAAVVYFLIIVPVNALVARANKSKVPSDPTTKKCPECLSEIPLAATRCAHCTAVIGSGAAAKVPTPHA